MQPWKPKDTIEGNPVHLPRQTVERLRDDLDQHVSSLFTLFHQYQKHHWFAEGPQFLRVHEFLQENYEQIHQDIDDLAERMTALGLVPTCSPAEQQKLSYIEHEPEGIFRIRDMLKRDIEAEGLLAEKLRETIRLATEHLLKGILAHGEERAHHLDHYLGEDTLETQKMLREATEQAEHAEK